MKFYVMTLFPQMILDGLNTSITGRAIESGALSVEAVDIRDFSQNKHLKVDDYPYGGGAGMVILYAMHMRVLPQGVLKDRGLCI